MQPRAVIYVSHVSNLSDARYCAGMGVDILGYVVDPESPDYVNPVEYQAMVGWVAGPRRAVEITSLKNIDGIIQEYAPDLLHVDYRILGQLPPLNIPLLVELPVADIAKATALAGKSFLIDHLLVTNVSLPSMHLTFMSSPPVLLQIDRPVDSLQSLLRRMHAAGVALRGSREISPGLKDYDHLSAVLEELTGSEADD